MEWPFVSRKKYNDLETFNSRQKKALQELEEQAKARDEQIAFTHNLYNLYRSLFAEASRNATELVVSRKSFLSLYMGDRDTDNRVFSRDVFLG